MSFMECYGCRLFCSRTKDDVTERTDCVLLPLQIFEMIHMSTYQHIFISRYSRISSILKWTRLWRNIFIDRLSPHQNLLQLNQDSGSFSNFNRKWIVHGGQMRWLMDVLNFARDKQSRGGRLLNNFLIEKADSPCTSPPQSPQHSQSLHTLQVPESKNSPDDSLKPNAEIRRCVSTSRLLMTSGSTDESDTDTYSRQKPPSTLELMDDKSKAYSSETLSVTYKLGACSNPPCESLSTVDTLSMKMMCQKKSG
ncbi:ankyrin repeat and fibronectin type-III domain-containing protein 1 [Caerostris extrusa]|uniref:Ankyrin repeat and fibronectin type-III domain-containing protein 1 n=1 Tax=Caerostris extrusa TaxID=172846 RepID=A0AAV4NG81_CAEEX|nr:ankyrin repeat and fibronectin type-III domain-containing protein 1 [Caerostris extrusa]